MTTNDRTPDRAQPGDLDGISDVPTYRPEETRSGMSDRIKSVYERAGRTAPQNIEPKNQAPHTPQPVAETQHTEAFPAASSNSTPATSNLYQVNNEPEHTTAMDRPQQQFAEQRFAEPAPATAPAQPAYAPEPAYGTEPAYGAPAYGAPVADTYADDQVAPVVEEPIDHRRGTLDFGLGIIRAVTGALLLFQGLRTFFELGGATGINGLKDEFANYAYGDLLSLVIPSLELAAGVFLLLGLLTPVAAALATVVTFFDFVHEIAKTDNFSFMNPTDSVLLSGLLCALAIGLQFTGPGRVSLDTSRSWARRPLASSWILAIVGIAGAIALWWFGAGVNPLG